MRTFQLHARDLTLREATLTVGGATWPLEILTQDEERGLVGFRAPREIPAGPHQVRMEFAYEGGGLGKGGTVELFVDGEVVGKGTVAATAAMVFSADDTCDVGMEGGALVAEDYPVPNVFTGSIHWVEIDVAEAAEDADHLITAEERLRVAMARQ